MSGTRLIVSATLFLLGIGLFVLVDDWCKDQLMAAAHRQHNFSQLRAVEGGMDEDGHPFLTVESTSRATNIQVVRAHFYVVEDCTATESTPVHGPPAGPRYVGLEQRSLEAGMDSQTIVFSERDQESSEFVAFVTALNFSLHDHRAAQNLFVRIHDDQLAGHVVNGILAITYEIDGERRVFSQKGEGLVVAGRIPN